MRQVVQSARTGRLALQEVPEPRVRAGHLLVRTSASLISAGTERMVVDFARQSLAGKARARPDLVRKVMDKARRDGLAATMRAVLARLDEPLPLGYSAAGRVVAVGSGLEGVYRVGDRVACAGAGLANHAELNVVPRALVAPIRDDVSFEDACFGTLGAIALHSVRLLGCGLGDVVAVVGVGLVGQMASQFLTLSGARVVVLDYDDGRLTLARRLGAELAWNLGDSGGLAESVAVLTGGRGCDAILVAAATDSSAPLQLAADLARDRARVVMVGKTGTEFPYAAFMKKELSVTVSRSYGPGRYDEAFEGHGVKYPVGWVRWTESDNLAEAVRLMGAESVRRLDVGALITHRFAFDRAEDAYALVMDGGEPHLGVVLRYGASDSAAVAPVAGDPPVVAPSVSSPSVSPPSVAVPVGRVAAARCVLGVIGAGAFARTVLLPELKRMAAVDLRTIVTTRGATAEHGQRTFGFAHAATDADAVLGDPAINAVLIATRHATHADLTARALAAGKSVLVEKPLALTRAELARVADALDAAPGVLLVGFNRRFAPLSVRAREHIGRHAGPKFAVLRVNAGALPADTWVNAAEEGGGRVLGELCHFIDLARYFIGSPIVSVQADAAAAVTGACDDVAVTVRFADGSLASIAYTALGDSAYSKERFEIFAGGTVVSIDNFLEFGLASGGRVIREKVRLGQDKGHRQELAAFVEAVLRGGAPPVAADELLETSLATIAAVESLRDGARIPLR